MKKIFVRIILLIALAFVFYTIFQLSAQNGEASSGLSKKVVSKIIDILPFTKSLSNDIKYKMIEDSQLIIRKLAHFSIYTLVGILIMAFMSTYEVTFIKKFTISIFVGLFYAMSDEFHQSFVPGRGPEIRDVCIDTLGVIFGTIIVLGIIFIANKIKSKKQIVS